MKIQSDEKRPWFDMHILDTSDIGSAVAGLGALKPGYVIVFGNQHHLSMADIGPTDRNDFIEYSLTVAQRVEHLTGGPVVVAEHGSSKQDGTSCINHVHLQLIPSQLKTLDLSTWNSASSLADLPFDRLAGTSYLMALREGTAFYRNASVEDRRFFRRAFAEDQGVPHEDDYIVWPRLASVRTTIDQWARSGAGVS